MKIQADNTNPRDESRAKQRQPSKQLAAAMIIRAFLDYHAAKKLIQKKRLTPQNVRNLKLRNLTDYETELLFNGKSAWEWLSRPPLPIEYEGRLTLQACMDTLDWKEKDIEPMFKPSAFREFLNATGRQIQDYEEAA